MIEVESIDMSGLEFLMGGLRDALIGIGESGDAAQLTQQTGRLLAKDIADGLPPKNQQKLNKNIDRDVRKVLSPDPSYFNIKGDHQESSISGMSWISAGPNFLLGVNDEDNMRGSGGVAYAFRKARNMNRGKKYIQLGTRGHQRVQRLNRILVTSTQFNLVKSFIKSGVGQMKASFAETYEKLGGRGVPGWIRRHFGRNQKKHIFDGSGLSDAESPSVTFGSRAPGIANYSGLVGRSVKRREIMTAKRLERVLSGYAEDHNSGRKIRRHSRDVDHE